MEKKSKISQFSSKVTTSTDAKKNQDVVSSRQCPKSSRKREPIVTSNFQKYDNQSRKSVAQKGKNFDKRPKPKGYNHGSTKEDSKVVDNSAELGSVMNQGSKKQSLNHLLNFHYAPRDMQSASEARNGRKTSSYNRNSNRWLPPIQRHKYNKEQFLQANCQFIVRENGDDYTAYLLDPDILVDWKLIEQIKLHTSDDLSCPICLSTPVAAKMTRCGHVFCWACILHYLKLSDKSWRKCPICYEAVHESDLKSVIQVTQHVMKVGDEVRLRLMRRERGSLIATSVPEKETPPPLDFFSVSDNSYTQIYSKLLLANVTNILDIIEFERVQLNLELMEDPQSPENIYIEQALRELEKREKEILIMNPKNVVQCENFSLQSNQARVQSSSLAGAEGTVATFENLNLNTETADRDFNTEEEIIAEKVDNCHQMKSEIVKSWWNGEEYELISGDKSPKMDFVQLPKQTENFINGSSASSNAQKYYYFYQAENGQNLYLHAMNVKMLEMQYGSLDQCPLVITGKLLEKDEGSCTVELRRRMRYLSHLPLTCQIEIAEIELLPPTVSEDVLKEFCDQIEQRQRKRQRKEREERKREKKINEEHNKQMGKFPTKNMHIESHRHFPEWQPEPKTGISIPSSGNSPTASSAASSPSQSSFDGIPAALKSSSWPLNTVDSGPSFAQMLRQNSTRSGNPWPAIKTSSGVLIDNLTTTVSTNQCDIDDGGDNNYVSLRNYNSTFGDAIAQAFEQSTLMDSAEKSYDESCTGGKKKKKKNKATVLFATGMARTS